MTRIIMVTFAAAMAAGSHEEDRAAVVRLAQETLERALGVAVDRMRVEEVRAVEWPDAALGCPEKGAQYAQIVVPGYSVRMEVDGAEHRVHVGKGRAVICDRPAASEAPKYMQDVVRVQDLARRDLATRLKVEAKDVKVLRIRPTTWPDADLGCPEPGSRRKAAETRGFLIELAHAGKTYVYHSDRERVVLCPAD
jgi:hypothetical protein